jgi:ribonucleoside-diphosphate reductase alpha chain
MADITLPSDYQSFIHLSRYARWLPDANRRETWQETVTRYFDFFAKHLKDNNGFTLDAKTREELQTAVLSLKVMPSMRCLMTAGEALEKENIAGYNCSYVAVDSPRAFDEILYILMNGTGVGFSVESQFVEQLPRVAEDFHDTDTCIIVRDSKLGWAKALKELVAMLYAGQIPSWDVSRVRPAGSPLKTFGGRASGPEPLVDLFKFCVRTFKAAAGRRLTTLECHDIVCKIAEIVVVGGVRRSALISLSDLYDDRMRHAKNGEWWNMNSQRALSNNSYVAQKERPTLTTFLDEWKALYESKSGERGIFSRYGAQQQAERSGRRSIDYLFGCNPCSEIILRSMEFCNLSEIVIRADDTMETLTEKVRLATILGTFQSTLTNFGYIRKEWKKNCDEERLLGVSLTGIMDSKLTNGVTSGLAERLEQLKLVAVETNKAWAEKLGISQSTAITCVKPSGTVSNLVDSASGIHARHSDYYIRTVRADKKDPLAKMMIDAGFYAEADVMRPEHTWVFSFPQKAPKGCITRNQRTAIEQLEFWRTYQDHWCEHKPSATIYVKEDEWLDVGAWIYRNFDKVSGLSFLPNSEHIYQQAPYQDLTKSEYEEWVKKMPTNVDWSKLSDYELTDHTTGTQELACSAGVCEIVDIASR